MTEHQLYQPGVLLGNLQEWVLQDAHLGVHLGSFSGVRHLRPSLTHPRHTDPAVSQAHMRNVLITVNVHEHAYTIAFML